MSESTSVIVMADNDYIADFPPDPERMAVGEVGARSVQAAQSLGANNASAGAVAVAAIATIELQMKMAMSFPRRKDDAIVALAQACRNPEFADAALYSYPQGGTMISGPSIKLAEEIGRHWGNLASGYLIVMDDDSQRCIRAWAWDMQTNTRREMDLSFAKLIQRKVRGQTEWVAPSEKELQQLTAAKAAIGVRNMILSLIPDSIKRDAVSWCRQTLSSKDRADPEYFKKRMMIRFANLGVAPDVLRDIAGKELANLRSPADDTIIEYLRGVYNRIDRGEANIQEILAERAVQLGIEGPAPQTSAELRSRVNAKAKPKKE